MTTLPRTPLVAALAACLSLTAVASGCNQDEPATYLPEAGEWTYLRTDLVGNSCADPNFVPDPFATFLLDYDSGDSFQIELGDKDVVCEIDGTDFDCTNYVVQQDIPGFEAAIQWSRTWEGEFASETEATGHEIVRVSCIGNDCNLVKELPCVYDSKFEAAAI